MTPAYKRKLFYLLFSTSVLRLLLASFTEFGNDEVYYWTYAQHLQWNYFDHPPMVALWIRFFTGDLALEQYEVFVRLGSIVSCAISTVLIFRIATRLHSEGAGWIAALLYNASIYASIIAGVFILPDSPQMVFWCSCLYLLLRIDGDSRRWKWWLLFGICAGLCIMSKVHGAFLWIGFGLYILFTKREYLRLPQLYVAAFITALIISPIFLWNIQNNFITYRYHSERVTVHGFALNYTGFARELFGEIFYNNPLLVFIIATALISWRKIRAGRVATLKLYNFIALPMIGVLIMLSLFRDTLPHWSGPAYVTLIPIAAIYLSKNGKGLQKARWALGIMVCIAIAGLCLINFYPGTMGDKSPKELGYGDFTLDMYGWREAGEEFQKLYKKEQASGVMAPQAPVICYRWFPAANEDYYFCREVEAPVIGLGTVHDLHHYVWLNSYRLHETNLQQAYCIVPSHESYDVRAQYSSYYKKVDSITTINNYRGGKMCRSFSVWRLQGWKNAPVPVPQHLQVK